MQTGPKVAIVHDYLLQDGGGERVLEAIHELFPQAPIFTLFYDPERAHPCFRSADIRTSVLQRWPVFAGHEHWALPFMASAIERFDLSGFDLVISSAISFAKGVITSPGTVHACYIHTPTRFLWHDRVAYVNDLPQSAIVKSFVPHALHRLRIWDRLAAERPTVLLTNSETSRTRIRHFYGRDATIIHPPVDVAHIPVSRDRGTYWLAGGRLVPYKRFDLVVKAFAKLNLPLKVFGVGPELPRLYALAGARTEFLGHVNDDEKIRLLQGAIGFLHPQIEDFGIAAVEAMAAGKPVIAYGQGGASETVIPGLTGTFIEAQTWEDIGDAIIRFNASDFNPARIRAHAEAFSKERFQKKFAASVEQLLTSYSREAVKS